MGQQLLRGDVFLFVGRCRRRAKVLHFDGTGLVLLTKRLFRGRFGSPLAPRCPGPLPATVPSSFLLAPDRTFKYLHGSKSCSPGVRWLELSLAWSSLNRSADEERREHAEPPPAAAGALEADGGGRPRCRPQSAQEARSRRGHHQPHCGGGGGQHRLAVPVLPGQAGHLQRPS
ncbi:IS66 family insertion sequence element accessory protein TnpB [Corallococcus carmarthensis]|uniref:IS66 family insertion sequence element accessory protein TnpB n=1 Tax=Corallococcus carmarthensis TaxID=2316728 RepID=UPI003F655ADD